MAIRLDVIRFNVYANLNDLDRSRPAVTGFVTDQVISRQMQALLSRMGHICTWNTTWKALVAGTSEYTVTPSAGDHDRVALMRLASSGELVERVSPELFERHREGVVTSGGGGPFIACLIPSVEAAGTPQKLTLRLHPTPAKADTLQALVSEMPLPVDEDSDAVPLSEVGARCLELKVSAELLARMPQEECNRLGISKEVGAVWITDAENLRLDEQNRVRRLQRGRQMNRSVP